MEDTAEFDALTPAELAWLDRKRLDLQVYILDLLPGVSSTSPTAETLDQLWLAFRATKVADNEAATKFVQALGVGLGDVLVEGYDFDWTILTDEYGTDIAVRTLPGTANTRVAPVEFVRKRYEDQLESDFIVHAVQEISNFVDKQRRDWEESGSA